MRVDNHESCQLAHILHCPRGPVYLTVNPMRRLCKACFVATFERDPIEPPEYLRQAS